jgi:transposase-like protein
MICPACNRGKIKVDNSRNTMDHYCDNCKRHFSVDYLDGYKDGLEDGWNDAERTYGNNN